jgi:predicted AAA+ superfamily ATPase
MSIICALYHILHPNNVINITNIDRSVPYPPDRSASPVLFKTQEEIIKSYVLDFAKHAPATDIPKLTRIWDSIPKHLARENKKFVFSAVKKGARGRAYENALTWLEDAGLIYRANAVASAKHPLKHYADTACFKVYALDVGLLGAIAKSPVELLVQGERLFNEYEGAFVENYVAQQLVSHFPQKLYYWTFAISLIWIFIITSKILDQK